jgi:hypothetical protein
LNRSTRLTWLVLVVTGLSATGCGLDAWLWPFGNYYYFKNGVPGVGTTTDLSSFLNSLGTSVTTTTDGTTGTTSQVPNVSQDFSQGSLEGWSVLNGSWVISGGQVQATSTSSEGYQTMVIGETTWTDYEVSVDIELEVGSEYALGVRFQNEQTWYLCSHSVGGIASITRFKSGSPAVELGVGSSSPLVPGEFYTFRVIVQGNTITFFAAGARVLSVTDTSDPIATGMVALIVPPGSVVNFDNVEISPLGG